MVTIIGCGNLNRSDDGIGVVVAQQLQAIFVEQPQPDVRVFDSGTSGMEIMFQARESSSLILIDACSSGSEPGAVFRVPGKMLAAVPAPAYNLHDFRWQHALHAGREIFRDTFPEDVEVFLVEAQTLALGTELSPVVALAGQEVIKLIRQRLGQCGSSGEAEPACA